MRRSQTIRGRITWPTTRSTPGRTSPTSTSPARPIPRRQRLEHRNRGILGPGQRQRRSRRYVEVAEIKTSRSPARRRCGLSTTTGPRHLAPGHPTGHPSLLPTRRRRRHLVGRRLRVGATPKGCVVPLITAASATATFEDEPWQKQFFRQIGTNMVAFGEGIGTIGVPTGMAPPCVVTAQVDGVTVGTASPKLNAPATTRSPSPSTPPTPGTCRSTGPPSTPSTRSDTATVDRQHRQPVLRVQPRQLRRIRLPWLQLADRPDQLRTHVRRWLHPQGLHRGHRRRAVHHHRRVPEPRVQPELLLPADRLERPHRLVSAWRAAAVPPDEP